MLRGGGCCKTFGLLGGLVLDQLHLQHLAGLRDTFVNINTAANMHPQEDDMQCSSQPTEAEQDTLARVTLLEHYPCASRRLCRATRTQVVVAADPVRL